MSVCLCGVRESNRRKRNTILERLHNEQENRKIQEESQWNSTGILKQGDFTICVVEHNGKRFVGVTKRNVRTDSHNEERAKTIAYERALKGESVRL